MYDIIIVGLGPAGLALGYRAHQQGLNVLGIDPQPGWEHTIGIFTDEIPTWMPTVDGDDVHPQVRTPAGTRRFARTYRILDAAAYTRALSTFDILHAAAHITDPTTVTADGRTFHATHVIDCRGIPHLRLPSSRPHPEPAQYARGVFLPHHQAGAFAAQNLWMGFDRAQADDLSAPDTFLYVFDTPTGVLVEETILVADKPHEQLLTRRLNARLKAAGIPQDTIDNAAVEHVNIPMQPHHHMGAGIGFGIRAGLITPISGYSVGTSWRLIDPLLDSLNRNTTLPWMSRRFQLDTALTTLSLEVLRALSTRPGATRDFFATVLDLEEHHLWGLLTPGDPRRTSRAMLTIFRRLRTTQRLLVIRALLAHLRPHPVARLRRGLSHLSAALR